MDLSRLKSRVQNKLRALNVSYECFAPVILVPAFIYTAAISREFSIISFLSMPVLLYVLYKRYLDMQYRTRFFYVWSLWSVIFGYMLFQSTVPVAEVLPEENIIFMLCVVLTVFLFYKTKSHAFNKAYWPTVITSTTTQTVAEGHSEETEHLMPDTASPEKVLEDIESGPEVDATPAYSNRIYQCNLCQTGVPALDHHNWFLDCCIGATNRKFFLLGCLMALITLLMEANLSLTSICHPYLIASIFGVHILMPDDCSDVYDQYDLAVCFVTSVYCLLLASYVFITVFYQGILISKGITATEWKLNIHSKVSSQKGSIYRNWVNYIRN